MRSRFLSVLFMILASLAWVPPAPAQVAKFPMGYTQQSISGLYALVLPVGVSAAIIGIEGNAIRFRDDGTPPTASVGQPIPAGSSLTYAANPASSQTLYIIPQTGTAVLNISLYK